MKESWKYIYKKKLILSTFFGSAYDVIYKIRNPILKEIILRELKNKK